MKNKGKLKEWLASKGKNVLGTTLEIVGDLTGKEVIENIGRRLMDDPDLTSDEKKEAAELIKYEIDLIKSEREEITKRWESDNQQDLKLPRLIRPSVIGYSWLLLTFILVAEYFEVEIKSSERVESLIELVNLAYFGSRGYEKIVKFKNRNK